MRKRVSLRDIREFAQSLSSDIKSWERYDMILDKLTESEVNRISGNKLCSTSDYKHRYYAELDFDDNDKGILMATCYDYDEVEKFADIATDKLLNEFHGEESMEFYKWHSNNYPKSVLVFEVPLTRGYSDTSRRDDTTFLGCDLDMAITEYLDEYHGCHKVYPWMLREICNPSDFGLTEDEFDAEVEMFLA